MPAHPRYSHCDRTTSSAIYTYIAIDVFTPHGVRVGAVIILAAGVAAGRPSGTFFMSGLAPPHIRFDEGRQASVFYSILWRLFGRRLTPLPEKKSAAHHLLGFSDEARLLFVGHCKLERNPNNGMA